MPPSKFVEMEIAVSDTKVEKIFKNQSFSRLTCAVSTKIMDKDAYFFDEYKNSCQVLAEVPPIKMIIDNDKVESMKIRVDGIFYIETNKLHV